MKRYLAIVAAICLCLNAGAADFLKGKILKIDMTKSVAERSDANFSVSMSGVSRSSSVSLLQFERALEKAAKDKEIAMVYINTDHFSGSIAAIEEIRASLNKFRESGKPVVAYGADLSNGRYYLASVADRVFINPKTEGCLTGLSSTQYFLKDLLDTLGVEVQLIRHGKFKSAGEMYIRNDISPENREQYEVMLKSLWDTMVEEMAASRGLSASELNAMADGLELGSAQSWVDKGLIDGLKYRDDMEDYLCHLFGTKDPSDVKTVKIEEYVDKVKKGSSKNKVAVIYADGQIVRSGGDIVGEKMSREIAKVRADSSVKAVVLRVNSPGGEVVAAEMIRREVELLKNDKPVIASYGSYAASGGYLISAGCDKIYTDNTTLTGSIGVFGLVPSIGKAVKKNLHINLVTMGTNGHSGMQSGINPMNEEEQAWYQQTIERIYDDFVGVVSEGRDMTKDEVDSLAQGRVWAGRDALQNGLADEKGTILDAVKYAAEKAGLSSYKIVCYPATKSLKEKILSSDEDKKDDPLVMLGVEKGLNTMAQMNSISIDF